MEKYPQDSNVQNHHSNPRPRKKNFHEQRDAIDPVLREQWTAIQDNLKKSVKVVDDPGFDIKNVKTVAAFDISARKENEDEAYASMVVMSYPDLKVLHTDDMFVTIDVPYCPGFLAFKEVPHFLELYERFKFAKPNLKIDVVLIDGNGILHCNECGCASHLGVLLDLPTIGCGKTIFAVDGINKNIVEEIKDDFRESGKPKGSYVLLKGKSGRVWGAGLKSGKDSNDPLIVSIGHRMSIETAIKIVDSCSFTRVPEPINFVDKRSRKLITELEKTILQKDKTK